MGSFIEETTLHFEDDTAFRGRHIQEVKNGCRPSVAETAR